MTLAQTLPAHKPSTPRLSFMLKVVLAGGLALLADIAFTSGSTFYEAGSVAGILAFLWLVSLLACDPLMRRSRASHMALAGAGLAALALLMEPGFIAALLFLAYLGLALFLPRYGRFGNALQWLYRLAAYGVLSPMAILRDAARLGKARRGRPRFGFMALVGTLPLTVAGSLVFLLLFSDANPLIERGLSQVLAILQSAEVIGLAEGHLVFLAGALIVLWSSFRPLRLRVLSRSVPVVAGKTGVGKRRVGATSIIPALAAFNLIFAAQNLSDLVFLWGDAALPNGVTFSDYAHKGTNALIVAALLAAVFVLVFLRTGSPLSVNSTVRRLVYAWICQTVLLVFSTMERTLNYIEAYSLTYTRLSALIFMTLVVAGLILICWRIARSHDGAWLINANALCLAVALGLASFTNFDALIARWNLAQGLQARSSEVGLDTYYIEGLGGSGALVPLAETMPDPSQPVISAILWTLRARLQAGLQEQQADWRRWTIAGAWRLYAAGPLPPRPVPIGLPQNAVPPARPAAPEIRATPNP